MSPLKRARIKKNWSGRYVAELAGISDATYYRIENGDPTTPQTAEAIAAVFDGGITEVEILYPNRKKTR